MRLRLVLGLLLCCLFFTIAFGCGKKGPPYIPRQVVHLRVEGLKAEWTSNGVMLKGVIAGPKAEKDQLGDMLWLRVFHAKYAISDRPCAGCPIPYQGYVDRSCGLEEHGNFSCFVPLKKKKGIYFFQVSILTPTGHAGPMSEKAILSVE